MRKFNVCNHNYIYMFIEYIVSYNLGLFRQDNYFITVLTITISKTSTKCLNTTNQSMRSLVVQ